MGFAKFRTLGGRRIGNLKKTQNSKHKGHTKSLNRVQT